MFLAVSISVLVLAAFSAAILITAHNARKRQAASVSVDLGGRLPAQRRRPCGRHGDGNCEDCDNKHHHHDHHDDACEGHCHGRDN